MRRIVTTAVAIALVGGALGAPAVAADTDRPATPGSFGVLDPSDLLELTPEPALPVLEDQVEPTATETLATARRVLASRGGATGTCVTGVVQANRVATLVIARPKGAHTLAVRLAAETNAARETTTVRPVR